jgi:hypothetical protein
MVDVTGSPLHRKPGLRGSFAELQDKNDSKLMDAGFRFNKVPTPHAVQKHDKM